MQAVPAAAGRKRVCAYGISELGAAVCCAVSGTHSRGFLLRFVRKRLVSVWAQVYPARELAGQSPVAYLVGSGRKVRAP